MKARQTGVGLCVVVNREKNASEFRRHRWKLVQDLQKFHLSRHQYWLCLIHAFIHCLLKGWFTNMRYCAEKLFSSLYMKTNEIFGCKLCLRISRRFLVSAARRVMENVTVDTSLYDITKACGGIHSMVLQAIDRRVWRCTVKEATAIRNLVNR